MQEWTLGLDENGSYCHEFLISNCLEFFYKHVIGFSASQSSLLNMAPIIHITLVSVSHWCLQINTITLSWAILCYSKNILCKKGIQKWLERRRLAAEWSIYYLHWYLPICDEKIVADDISGSKVGILISKNALLEICFHIILRKFMWASNLNHMHVNAFPG